MNRVLCIVTAVVCVCALSPTAAAWSWNPVKIVNKTVNVVKKGAKGTQKAAKKAGKLAVKGGKEIVKGTKKGAEKAGKLAAKGGKEIVEGTKKGAGKTGEVAKKTGQQVANGTKKVAGKAAKVPKKVAEVTQAGAKKTAAGAAKVVRIAEEDVVKPVANTAVDMGRDLRSGLKDGAQNGLEAIRYVDNATVQRVKSVVANHVVAPVAEAVVDVGKPMVSVAHEAIDSAADFAHMQDSFVPFGDDLGKGVGFIVETMGVSPEVAKNIVDPTRIAREVTGHVARETPALVRTVATQANSAISIDPTKPIGAALETSLAGLNLASGATFVASRPFIGQLIEHFMLETPTVIDINPGGFAGSPIYLVNGIDVSLETAKEYGLAVSRRFHRPVALVYNEDNGKAVGGLEGLYDRFGYAVQFGPLKALQGDATTRQLTAVLMQAKDGKPLDIIGHSQGNLIIKNALEAAALLGKGDFIRNRVHWVACSPPFVNAEVQPKPHSIHYLSNTGDFISQGLGVRMANDPIDGDGHGFRAEYLNRIDPTWLSNGT